MSINRHARDITILCVIVQNPKMPQYIFKKLFALISGKSAKKTAKCLIGLSPLPKSGQISEAVKHLRKWNKNCRIKDK